MPPNGGETGKYYNASVIADFVIWNRQTKLGIVIRLLNLFQTSQWFKPFSRCIMD
ncbi:hypothetical protein [Okeania sp. SIO2C9]|uniref:hypothetical protein n=1 Tax=Okeania sp. SIO2C9 TaxID=2607791 RepID=UPI00345C9AD6